MSGSLSDTSTSDSSISVTIPETIDVKKKHDVEIDQVPKYLQESLTCPITAELFQDPVIASDGATYE